MEPVTHTCGARLWRIETGGVRRIVAYSADGRTETHTCPGCGANLSDTDLRDVDGEPLWQPPDTA